jgi:hypothetical protein
MLRLAGVLAALGLALAAQDAAAGAACPSVGFTLVEPRASPDTRPVKLPEGQVLFVRRDAITTTNDIAEIRLSEERDATLILLKFKPEAAARLQAVTTNRSGIRIAFLVDDRALLAPVWQGPYGMDTDGTQVSLNYRLEGARALVDAVRRCAGAGGARPGPP